MARAVSHGEEKYQTARELDPSSSSPTDPSTASSSLTESPTRRGSRPRRKENVLDQIAPVHFNKLGNSKPKAVSRAAWHNIVGYHHLQSPSDVSFSIFIVIFFPPSSSSTTPDGRPEKCVYTDPAPASLDGRRRDQSILRAVYIQEKRHWAHSDGGFLRGKEKIRKKKSNQV